MPINDEKLKEIRQLSTLAEQMARYLESQNECEKNITDGSWSHALSDGYVRLANYGYEEQTADKDKRECSPFSLPRYEWMDEFYRNECDLLLEFVSTIYKSRREFIERKLKELEVAIRDAGQSL